MAYFREPSGQEDAYARRFSPPPADEQEEDFYDGYDDGFDELTEQEVPEADIPPEEKARERRRLFRIAAGFGDLGASILGVLVILALVAFLIALLRFLSSDFSQTFSLWLNRL